MERGVAGVLARRLSVTAVAMSLLVGACGGSSSSNPVLVIPSPEVPPLVLATDHGGPTAPGRVCIEQDFGLLFVPVEVLTDALAAIGVQVATGNCDATLRFEGTAARSSARYQPARVCYEGWKVDGAITWRVGGREMATWPVTAERAAPQWIEVCTAADAAIDLSSSELRLGSVLVDLFGGAGLAAAAIQHAATAEIGVQPGAFDVAVDAHDVFDAAILPPDPGTLGEAELDAAVARVADGLHRATTPVQRDWLAYAVLWLSKQPCCLPHTRTLEPVVPYLVEALAAQQSPDSTLARHLMALLGRLTSRSFDSPGAWLDWWRRSH